MGRTFVLTLDRVSVEWLSSIIFSLLMRIVSLDPGSGILMKIWECYDNLPAQAWYYTDDERIALAGQGKFAGDASSESMT